ncbi:MAG: glycosyltransferase [Bacteroidetes bacterium]|nr:MAG: glycosyltransferase [Bacteroidota bacterium]
MSKKKIAAVVITYNRLDFLKEIVDSLRKQSLKMDLIIVVNNSSTDGTKEWLQQQSDLKVIEQENVGSSGGQYTGIKAAYEDGFDWIWTMDDDVIPEPNCLEKLMEKEGEKLVRVPLRYNPDGKPFYNDVVKYNLKNPFKKFWQEIITERHLKEKFIKLEGITFEGPLFHRTLIEKIGLPEFNFFIFGDDTEYFMRLKETDYKIVLFSEAHLNRKLKPPTFKDISPWKKFYTTRNLIAIMVKHGSFAVRLLSPFKILIIELIHINSLEDLKFILKGFFKGYFYKSVNPSFQIKN